MCVLWWLCYWWAYNCCLVLNETFGFVILQKECEYCKEKAPPFSYSYGEILPFKCHRLKTVKIKCGERDERFIALVKLFFKISVCIEKFDLDRWWVRVQACAFLVCEGRRNIKKYIYVSWFKSFLSATPYFVLFYINRCQNASSSEVSTAQRVRFLVVEPAYPGSNPRFDTGARIYG